MSKLSAKSINKKYRRKHVINNVSIEFDSSEITCIVGKNGVGKTTLLKCLAKELDVDSGQVKHDGSNRFNKLRDVLLIPDCIIIPGKMMIKDVITMFMSRNDKYNKSYIEEYLNFLNIDEEMVFETLSKGNQEIVQMALLISNCPKFIIFDEPFAAVDITKRDFLYNKIIDLNADGAGIIITSHIIGEMQNIFSDVVILNDSGQVRRVSVDSIYEQGYADVNDYLITNI